MGPTRISRHPPGPWSYAAVQQHFVPRFYLALFTDPLTPPHQTPWVWVGDVRSRDVTRRAPRNVCVESNYHEFTTVHGKSDSTSIEEILRDIESQAAPLLRRLNADPGAALDEAERERLSLFIGLMATRVPRFRSHFEKQVGQIAEVVGALSAHSPSFGENIERMRAEHGWTDQQVEDLRQSLMTPGQFEFRASPSWSLKVALDMGIEVAKLVRRMQWTVMSASADDTFITSDAPARWWNPGLPPGFGRGGLGMKSAEFTFPLNPRAGLLATWTGRAECVSVTNAAVSAFNARTLSDAGRHIFASAAKTVAANLERLQGDQQHGQHADTTP